MCWQDIQVMICLLGCTIRFYKKNYLSSPYAELINAINSREYLLVHLLLNGKNVQFRLRQFDAYLPARTCRNFIDIRILWY